MSDGAVKTAVAGGRLPFLPTGWKWNSLGELAEIVSGQSPPSESYRNTREGLPFFQGKADFSELYPVARSWCVAPERIAEPGDILLSVRAPVGPTNIADMRCCIGRGLAAVRPLAGIDRDFLLLALRHFESGLAKLGSGSTFSAITRGQLQRIQVPTPALDEQRRISAQVFKQMSIVKRARAAAEARLAAAGKLRAAHLRSVLDSSRSPNWPLRPLGELCERVTDGTHQPPRFTSFGIPFLFVRNIVAGEIDFRVANYVSEQTYLDLTKRFRPSRGDVLYSAVGSFGVAVPVMTDERFVFQRHIAVLRPKVDDLDPEFLSAYLNSPSGRAQSEEYAFGGAQRTVTLSSLSKFAVPTPPLTEQIDLVKQLNEFSEMGRRLRQAAREELGTLELLPPALLRSVFEGEI